MRRIDTIIVHHTGSTFGDVATIDRWHRGPPHHFDEIGYHFVILNGWRSPSVFDPTINGVVQVGRALEKVGAHDLGQNEGSVGVGLVGLEVFTWPQLRALHELVQGLRAGIENPVAVEGHLEHEPRTTPTDCPGSRLARDLDGLRAWLNAGAAELGPGPFDIDEALAPR